ncbi:MAG TPA: glycoside hydrolase family 36 protein [Terriglobales bacterium]|nr:glycoside hydrolase family 36 protein [Terriglobales bacterium]
MPIDRRTFLVSSGVAAFGALMPSFSTFASAAQIEDSFEWKTSDLVFHFEVSAGRLRQQRFVPVNVPELPISSSSGVEVALQCNGENSPDPGMKSATGEPGARLQFAGKREETMPGGKRLICTHSDPVLQLSVESVYEAFDGVPVVRRYSRIRNNGSSPVGIDFLSSAMLHGLADPRNYDHELRIHVAFNSWMAEGQWHTLRPSEMGFVENERTSWSEAHAGSIGSWSTERFLPMAMAENTSLGLIWFWQIEHNGSWYWEISNVSARSNYADDVYAYLGGPDDLHSAAWKNLKPGETYQTVPVAIGCVRGGFSEAIVALTQYRRSACVKPRGDNSKCPVIFNDFMNCLWANPTEAKELPLIAAAAKAGCDYFVIDAGWYAELHEDWSQTIGAWQPSTTRWPHGLKFVLDQIRQAGMVPGLWLEPEVAGAKSVLAQKPDDWFLVRHGKRVWKNSRFLLDFRNPAVRAYLDQVLARIVNDYGVGYIKMDYNVDSLQGTEINADSFGQGLLEHNRAHLAWLEGILNRYPELTIENCGSGGGRMDYAMLSRLQIQSMTDQEDYLKLPGILAGASAAVLPEQLAIWSYPLANADADQASFNMATAMMCRIHQSGRLDSLSPACAAQVAAGIRIYKDVLRGHIPTAVPFYPLGLSDVTNFKAPIALGMRSPKQNLIGVWRIDGPATTKIPWTSQAPKLIYPTDLGIQVTASNGMLNVEFPRPRMACLISA